MNNVVAEELLRHINTPKPYDRIWVVKLNQNYWDWMSRAIHVVISVFYGRPKWQHTAILYKPAHQNKVWWMEVLVDGVHEYEVDFENPDLEKMLRRMLFSFYESVWVSDKELEGISERLQNVYEASFESGVMRYWRFLTGEEAEYSGEVVCTTFVSYVLTGVFTETFDKPCRVFYRCTKSPLLYTELVTRINLSDWRNPNAAY